MDNRHTGPHRYSKITKYLNFVIIRFTKLTTDIFRTPKYGDHYNMYDCNNVHTGCVFKLVFITVDTDLSSEDGGFLTTLL